MSDYANMTDDELEAATASAFAEEPAAGPDVEAPAEVESPAPEAQQAAQPEEVAQQPDPAASQEQERIQRHVPLDEHIALRRRAQEAERLANEAQARLDAIEAQRQQNALQAEYDRLFEEVGPEAAEHYRVGLEQQHAERQRIEQQAQQQTLAQRVDLSEQFARQTLPDYDAQVQKVIDRFGVEEAYRLSLQHANPAMWAYELGKSFETPEERAAVIQAEVQKALAAALSKQSPPPSRGQTSVGHLSSSSGGRQAKSFDEMTDAELEEAERESRAGW